MNPNSRTFRTQIRILTASFLSLAVGALMNWLMHLHFFYVFALFLIWFPLIMLIVQRDRHDR